VALVALTYDSRQQWAMRASNWVGCGRYGALHAEWQNPLYGTMGHQEHTMAAWTKKILWLDCAEVKIARRGKRPSMPPPPEQGWQGYNFGSFLLGYDLGSDIGFL